MLAGQSAAEWAGLLLIAVAASRAKYLYDHPGPVRSGPWPGLTVRGAETLLAYALLLAGTQLVLGSLDDAAHRRALPYLPLLSVGSGTAVILGAFACGVPGSASAIAGAYLLPRSLVSVLFPDVSPPALLLPSACAADLVLWLHGADISALADLAPRRGAAAARRVWRKRVRPDRRPSSVRTGLAGVIYALLLALLEPAQSLLLGSPSSDWAPPATWLAAGLSIVATGFVTGLVGVRLRAPSVDTASGALRV